MFLETAFTCKHCFSIKLLKYLKLRINGLITVDQHSNENFASLSHR